MELGSQAHTAHGPSGSERLDRGGGGAHEWRAQGGQDSPERGQQGSGPRKTHVGQVPAPHPCLGIN